jgi:septal ring factor EnvC (AmiA/AmiB activator)
MSDHSDTAYVPTTLKSEINDPSQVTYTTRFWELPDNARNELAELQQFINEQAEKRDRIQSEINSGFASTLKQVQEKTEDLNVDADILTKQLDIQSGTLYDLIDKNAEQRRNVMAAGSVLRQESRNWRTLGASENWHFFTNTVNSLESRTRHYAQAVQSIEEAVSSLDKETKFSPELLADVMAGQKRMYLSLAGRVAEIHEEVERIVKRRKL